MLGLFLQYKIFRSKQYSIALIERFYTTNEFKIPTKKTKKIHKPMPEKTVLLFSDQPSGYANATGTPTTKTKESPTRA